MNQNLLVTLFNLLIILGIAVVLLAIWFVFWTGIRHPIRMKDDILKEREEARKDLVKIQAAKGVEWDNYKKLQDETDKLRKAYFQAKSDLDETKSNLAKEQIQKEKVITKNRELTQEIKSAEKTKKS